MSELMDRAVIGMPFDMAMQNHLSRMQFYNRAKAILTERDALMAERDALRARLEAAGDALDNLVCVSLYEGFDSPRLRHHVELIALALDPADESGAPS